MRAEHEDADDHGKDGACEDCAGELRLIEAQAQTLRSLRCNEEVEPRAGFYARVMNRIEQRGPASIWSLLLQPSFGRRLALASATLVLLLGAYHGLNPGMGWLFAVALGMQERKGSAVARALVPIALGHALAIGPFHIPGVLHSRT